jgi:hypothetical protein
MLDGNAPIWNGDGRVSVPDERYPDLHRLIERLEPEQAAQVREQILRSVTPARGLRVLGAFDGPEEDDA